MIACEVDARKVPTQAVERGVVWGVCGAVLKYQVNEALVACWIVERANAHISNALQPSQSACGLERPVAAEVAVHYLSAFEREAHALSNARGKWWHSGAWWEGRAWR